MWVSEIPLQKQDHIKNVHHIEREYIAFLCIKALKPSQNYQVSKVNSLSFLNIWPKPYKKLLYKGLNGDPLYWPKP